MKPLSEVAPGLLVIQIQIHIHAVWFQKDKISVELSSVGSKPNGLNFNLVFTFALKLSSW